MICELLSRRHCSGFLPHCRNNTIARSISFGVNPPIQFQVAAAQQDVTGLVLGFNDHFSY
jgi:hypothetical protein